MSKNTLIIWCLTGLVRYAIVFAAAKAPELVKPEMLDEKLVADIVSILLALGLWAWSCVSKVRAVKAGETK